MRGLPKAPRSAEVDSVASVPEHLLEATCPKVLRALSWCRDNCLSKHPKHTQAAQMLLPQSILPDAIETPVLRQVLLGRSARKPGSLEWRSISCFESHVKRYEEKVDEANVDEENCGRREVDEEKWTK